MLADEIQKLRFRVNRWSIRPQSTGITIASVVPIWSVIAVLSDSLVALEFDSKRLTVCVRRFVPFVLVAAIPGSSR